MLANHSPEKENRSPSPRRHNAHKPFHKQPKTIAQFLQLLKTQGVSVPPHLISNHTPPTCLKLIDQGQSAHFRSQMADKEFQIKKLQEDFAEYKLLSRLEREKAVKKLKEELQFEKNRHGEETRKWQAKFSETMERHLNQIKLYRQNLYKSLKEEKEMQIENIKQKYLSQVQNKQQQKQQQKIEFTQTIKHLKQDYESKINQIKKIHQHDVQQLNLNFTQQIKKTQQIFEIKVLAIQCEKHAEVKVVQQTKKQTEKTNEKYLIQIGKLQRERKEAVQKFDQMEMRCKVLQKRYQDKQNQIVILKSKHQGQLQDAFAQLQRVKSETKELIEKQTIKVLKDEYQKTQKFQNRFQKFEQIHENMMGYYKMNQKALQVRFERRQSKKEDVQFIKAMEQQLFQKEKEANILFQNLKLVQLQKLNNDKLYTRIFTANRKQRKSSSNRIEKDIYSVFKQSHTMDFRHLLKIAHKDKQTKR